MNTKKRVAWGITGSGDRLNEVFEVMKQVNKQYNDQARLTVYLSKAADLVVKYYRLYEDLKKSFNTTRVEINSNMPTLAVQLQSGKIDFLLIAPATSNTVAKIATGIADTLICNAAIMALKAFIPVYILPCDLKEGVTVTQIPDGSEMKLRVRKEDAEHVQKLATMDGIVILEKPEEIFDVFKKHFNA
ncbi:MAG: archaeoflavoprotein AfpA [Candidatus Bathyarchaeia archaeon]|jgi:archaeoflavoprotein AfpA